MHSSFLTIFNFNINFNYQIIQKRIRNMLHLHVTIQIIIDRLILNIIYTISINRFQSVLTQHCCNYFHCLVLYLFYLCFHLLEMFILLCSINICLIYFFITLSSFVSLLTARVPFHIRGYSIILCKILVLLSLSEIFQFQIDIVMCPRQKIIFTMIYINF